MSSLPPRFALAPPFFKLFFLLSFSFSFPLELSVDSWFLPTSWTPKHPSWQVWIGGLSAFQDGSQVLANFKNMDTLIFQDRIGQIVQEAVQFIPYGVLFFFPSYKALEKMIERWKLVGIWAKILEYKSIVVGEHSSSSWSQSMPHPRSTY